jgi:hypothetical protein
MTHETTPDLKGTVMANVDGLLAALIDWQLDFAIPDTELDAALADIGIEGDANAADMFREARWTMWAVVRTLEALSGCLHDELDLF